MKKGYSLIFLGGLWILSVFFPFHIHAWAAPAQTHLDFDGIDDKVVVGDSGSLDITDAITLEAWIRPYTIPDSNGQSRVISKGIALK